MTKPGKNEPMLARKDARAAEKGARTAQREAKHASKAAEVAAKASRQYGAAPAVVNPTPAEPPTRRTGKPRLRPAVAALPAYVPGARGDGRPMWKLSSNENPNPPLTGLLAALSDQLAEVNRYPDMYATELTEALAGRLGVAREGVDAQFAERRSVRRLGGAHDEGAIGRGLCHGTGRCGGHTNPPFRRCRRLYAPRLSAQPGAARQARPSSRPQPGCTASRRSVRRWRVSLLCAVGLYRQVLPHALRVAQYVGEPLAILAR